MSRGVSRVPLISFHDLERYIGAKEDDYALAMSRKYKAEPLTLW
jgi:hypothetical protein